MRKIQLRLVAISVGLALIISVLPVMTACVPEPTSVTYPSTPTSGLTGTNILINEVLFYPAGPNGTQWIELYNPTNSPIHLSGWFLANADGSVISTLPAWDLPSNSYLVVHLKDGQNDSDFSDGLGTFFTGTGIIPLDTTQDSLALYSGQLGQDTIVDFVAWAPDSQQTLGNTGREAVAAGIWPNDASVAISFGPTNAVLLPGESLGRNSNSDDTNRIEDFLDHGGSDSFILTPGKKNSILFGFPIWYLSKKRPSTHANAMFNLLSYPVTDTTVTQVQVSQGPSNVTATATHTFTIEHPYYGEVIFTGSSTASWNLDGQGNITEEVTITVAPENATYSGQIFTSNFQRSMNRGSLGVTSKTYWTMTGDNDQEPFYLLDQSLESILVSENEYHTTGKQTIKPGPGMNTMIVDYLRTETIEKADLVSGQTNVTIQSGSQSNTLETKYQRILYEDLGAYEFLLGFAFLLERSATYEVFDFTVGGKTFKLTQIPGRTTITKTTTHEGYQGTFSYDWSINLVAIDGEELSLGFTGKEEIIGNMTKGTYIFDEERVVQVAIDPSPDPVSIWFKGAAVVIGLGIGIYQILEDDTPPEIGFRPHFSGCDSEEGWQEVLVSVRDINGGIEVDSDLDWQSYDADIDDSTKGIKMDISYPNKVEGYPHNGWWLEVLRNPTDKPITIQLEVSVSDEHGNRQTRLSKPITVQPRCPQPPSERPPSGDPDETPDEVNDTEERYGMYHTDGPFDGSLGHYTEGQFAVSFNAEGPKKIEYAEFYISSSPAPFQARIYNADREVIEEVTAVPMETGWFRVDFSGSSKVEGDFFIGIFYTNESAPLIGQDSTSPQGQSWLIDPDGTWEPWSEKAESFDLPDGEFGIQVTVVDSSG